MSLTVTLPSASPQSTPRASTQSPHGTLNLPCTNCHTFTAWKPIRNIPEFDHNQTPYPLRGMHVKVTCMQCHTKLVFSNVGKKCADCHADFHRRQFGAACEQCHTVAGWRVSVQSIRQHQNRFPLVGAHASVPCESCHQQAAAGRFEGLSTNCYSCHTRDYQTPVFDHRAMGIVPTCNACHSMDSWLGAKFDHARFAGFTLSGVHATLDCTACHIGGRFKGTPADCASCHINDFNKTTNPNHKTAGFPTDCSICHSTSGWIPAAFDHSKVFPLTGVHATLSCVSCHANGNFTGVGTTCVSCHLKDYNNTTNPNHKASGIPTDCAVCHSTASWQPASFDHSKTPFPLTGAHVNVACASCHVGGRYAGTPTDCYSCHQAQYTGTTNPNHVAAQFPTTCNTCHSTISWLGAVFNHTWFPIYSGTHAGKWMSCGDCHVNTSNFAVFSCITCHQHDASIVNPNHSGVSGYTYTATSCYSCHPTGQGGN